MESQLYQAIHRPLIPAADNFTPRERTPWGGTKIAKYYKKWLNLPDTQIIGESWEISGHPSFPNHFQFKIENHFVTFTLTELLQQVPDAILGKIIAKKFKNRIPLLVKIVDSADNLSIQVHPDDHYPRLKPGEMGKTEAWYILDAEPDAGIYLGLQPNVTRNEFETALKQGTDISKLLNFVPVKPGEIYFIPAGTIHAIGKGITLLEPQQTSETTYRVWDWNRLYGSDSQLSATGKPRQLHIDDSMAVINFNNARGQAFIDEIKGKPQLIFDDDGNTIHLLLNTPHFVIEKIVLKSPKPLFLHKEDFFVALTVIKGHLKLTLPDEPAFETTIPSGQSVLIPAAVTAFEMQAVDPAPVELIKVFYPTTNK
ncbi:class I mannose-6-phosphate isomerase [candidate division KSB1 bacterium]|nr:class I mannose-6-phosphate isomerase [candidate division KSB1 bacterium]